MDMKHSLNPEHPLNLKEEHPGKPRIWYAPSEVFNKLDRSVYTNILYNKWKKDELRVLSFKSLVLTHLQEEPYFIRLNDFPYDVDHFHHYIMWIRNRTVLERKYIENILNKNFPIGKIVMFENEDHKKSIHDIFHIHIFSEYRRKAQEKQRKCTVQ